MFSKLIEIIKQAFNQMFKETGNSTGNIPLSGNGMPNRDLQSIVSYPMQAAIDQWNNMYKDCPEWENKDEGIFSIGIPAFVCSELARSVLLEFKSVVTDSTETQFNPEKDIPVTHAQYLESVYYKHILQSLRENLEHAMAVGGMIIKPYVNNGKIYIDFCMQGEFIPLAFDDDGNVTDIAFYSSVIESGKKYVKIERHYFNQLEKTVTVANKCFVTDNINSITENLGRPVPLREVPAWAGISEEPVVLHGITQPLYGFYKVPKKNTVDLKSPLGASVFARAVKVIRQADIQFSRLDFEYLGGSMAIDVEESLLDPSNPRGLSVRLPEARRRVFRGIDTMSEELYKVFAPSLRDENYIRGFNTYLMRIEDLCELSRGTLSDPNVEARTATEMLILKQRAYSNIADNQKALEKALKDAIYAIDAYLTVYGFSKPGEYYTDFSWDDSVITDKAAQMEEKIALLNEGVLSKAEVRAWYTGESEEEAQLKIDAMESKEPKLDDIFTAPALNGEPVIEEGKEGKTDEDVND